MPLAIMEAKRERLPPEHGLQQGKDYRVGDCTTSLSFSVPTGTCRRV